MKNEKIIKLKFWTKQDREIIKKLEKMVNYNPRKSSWDFMIA